MTVRRISLIDQYLADACREIDRLRNQCEYLQSCINSRDEFIGYAGLAGLWETYVSTLPTGKDDAGAPY